jgi:hypothetical protein
MTAFAWVAAAFALPAIGVIVEYHARRAEERRHRSDEHAAHLRLMRELEQHR